MVPKVIITVAAVLFAIGGFLGVGPTEGGPLNPFGWIFVGLAVGIWFKWAAIRAGFYAAKEETLEDNMIGGIGSRRHDPSSRRSPSSSS
jgi:hypothetical protein